MVDGLTRQVEAVGVTDEAITVAVTVNRPSSVRVWHPKANPVAAIWSGLSAATEPVAGSIAG